MRSYWSANSSGPHFPTRTSLIPATRPLYVFVKMGSEETTRQEHKSGQSPPSLTAVAMEDSKRVMATDAPDMKQVTYFIYYRTPHQKG